MRNYIKLGVDRLQSPTNTSSTISKISGNSWEKFDFHDELKYELENAINEYCKFTCALCMNLYSSPPTEEIVLSHLANCLIVNDK